MQHTIFVTGATDGIGLETARILISLGHHVLLHGRSREKVEAVERALSALPGGGRVESYLADLSVLAEVESLASAVADQHDRIDVLINNAGVFNASDPVTPDKLDIRFAVNTIAPYLLTHRLLPRLGRSGRIINVASAGQAPVELKALAGEGRHLSDYPAYAQSKLALIIWSRSLAASLGEGGPAVIAVNPGSLLATKMVKEAFGVLGGDVGKGAEILRRAALDEEFATASGQYFDNDAGRFAQPHPDALDRRKCEDVVRAIDAVLKSRLPHDWNAL